jgi:hypothetical protein
MRRSIASCVCHLGAISLVLSLCTSVRGEQIDADVQARINVKLKEITAWAASPEIVKTVKARNLAGPGIYKDMTQAKWKTLSVLDPQVRVLTRNEVALYIKSKKDPAVSEAFASCADGTKVGFLTKTTYWDHTGKPKHDQPMKGEIWRGPLEVDESTGVQQIQVAVPILDEGKAIGSLVVGLELAKLKD